ncbi:MAG: hypothetical protein K6E91_01110 [Butyrivibrio sp.]|nr:hypothetical protein [Butyrivibrio sp.]
MVDDLYINQTNFMLGLAAIFIQLGMIVYTSLYRRRGKPEDKLFFVLLMSGIAFTVVEEIIAYHAFSELELTPLEFFGLLNLDFLIFEFFSMIWCVYLAFRNGWNIDKRRKYIPMICLPGLATMAIVITNYLIYYFHPVRNPAIKTLRFLYRYATELPILFALLFTILVIRRYFKRGLILIAVLFSAYIFLKYYNSLIFADPIFMSIVLIYAHLYTLREPFYGEVHGI